MVEITLNEKDKSILDLFFFLFSRLSASIGLRRMHAVARVQSCAMYVYYDTIVSPSMSIRLLPSFFCVKVDIDHRLEMCLFNRRKEQKKKKTKRSEEKESNNIHSRALQTDDDELLIRRAGRLSSLSSCS